MISNIGLLNDKYSQPWAQRILYGRTDWDNKGHEDDVIPYDIGMEIYNMSLVEPYEPYCVGNVIENDFDKIVNFFENRLEIIIKERCKLKEVTPNYYLLEFNDIIPTKQNISGIIWSDFEMTDKFVRINCRATKITYKISYNKSNGKDLQVKINRPKFNDLTDRDKWNYLVSIAENLDIYYLRYNLYDRQNYLKGEFGYE